MRKFPAVALAALIALNASAAPASQESVEELLAVTKSEATMDSMYASMEQMMRQGMQQSTRGKTFTPEQQRILDGAPAKFLAVLREEFNWAKMKPMIVQVYRDTFEQEEVDGLVVFYKSAAGRAFIDKMPTVMQKSMALTQSQMQSVTPKLRAAMEQAIAEAKAAN